MGVGKKSHFFKNKVLSRSCKENSALSPDITITVYTLIIGAYYANVENKNKTNWKTFIIED